MEWKSGKILLSTFCYQVELISKGALLKDLVDQQDIQLVWNQLQIPVSFDGYPLEKCEFYRQKQLVRHFICLFIQ